MILKKICIFVSALSSLSAAAPDTKTQPPPADAHKAKPSVAAFVELMESARALAKAKDFELAEDKLTAFNLALPGTAQWHLETAQKLNEMTAGLARAGHNEEVVISVANLSLQHLEQAATLAKDSQVSAQAKAAEGVIYLRYLGDMTSAIRCYQAAAHLDPKDPGIQHDLDRLVSTDAKLRARIQNPKP